ncbi:MULTISPECIES: PKD domain-containing protein [Microbulbifer]|uniref:PKD domain-containing protein n=1 Tax=Microbulbifer TaxID=48073 RepID=UPI001CD48046|nr:right-handed parallel beta-helix repeat-containing protein [Microbulbifer agarilyticus]MCA0900240.1 right-handed parallel beta-helix repeat-containing protein [Microbulbifer agarilyticus]
MKYFFIHCVICLLLVGCGGGSGSDGGNNNPPADNRAPVAEAGSNQSTMPGQSVILNGADSSDADGDTLSYQWSVVQAPSGAETSFSASTSVETNFSADIPGTYEIRLTVNDGAASDTDSVSVVIAEDSDALVANAGTGYSGADGEDITLDGRASTGPSGESLTYSWSITSGPSDSTAILSEPNSATPVLSSASVGSYEVTLVVTSESGGTDSDIAHILVLDYLPITQVVEHYTQILPADDTRVIYVSSQEGNDANDGLSSSTPVQSIQHGARLLRDGHPDWLALKSGDTWETGIGGWIKSGRSASEPMVITSYGIGESRPLLRTRDETAFRYQGGGGSPEYVDFLVIHGLHFYAISRDPNAGNNFTGVSDDRGITWFRGTNGLLIEDNMFELYKEAITLEEIDGFHIRNVLIKNNVFIDSYNVTGSHAQGIYLDKTDNVRIERNIFDHIGWNDSVAGAEKTMFNHAIYVQTTNRDIEIVDNIITRSSSNGIQLRSGGLMDGNVLVQNAIGLMLGGDQAQGNPGVIKDNIVLHGSDISASEPRGWGIDLATGIVSAEITDNIVAHEESISENLIAIRESDLATRSGNAVYNWGAQSEPASSFVNAALTINDFDSHAGGNGTMESFYNNIRAHSQRSPNPNYDVEEIRQYFKDAFSPAQ